MVAGLGGDRPLGGLLQLAGVGFGRIRRLQCGLFKELLEIVDGFSQAIC